MVGFEGRGTVPTCRAFIECIYIAGRTLAGEGSCVVTYGVAQVGCSVPAWVLNLKLEGKVANAPISITYHNKTCRFTIRCPVVLEVCLLEQLIELESWTAKLDEEPDIAPPNGAGRLIPFLRNREACLDTEATTREDFAKGARPQIFDDPKFIRAIAVIADNAKTCLEEFPTWNLKLERFLQDEFGLPKGDDAWMMTK